jgi:hypothetical protein
LAPYLWCNWQWRLKVLPNQRIFLSANVLTSQSHRRPHYTHVNRFVHDTHCCWRCITKLWARTLSYAFFCFSLSRSRRLVFCFSLKNPTLGFLIAEADDVLGRRTGSDPAKPKNEASFRRLYDNEVVVAVSQTIPSGHRAAPRRTSTSMGLCWWWLFNSTVLEGLIWTTRSPQGKKWRRL